MLSFKFRLHTEYDKHNLNVRIIDSYLARERGTYFILLQQRTGTLKECWRITRLLELKSAFIQLS